MMGYKLFKDVIMARLPELLPPVYGDCSVTVKKMFKVNEEKDCLSVLPRGGRDMVAACPNIYLDEFYEQFMECQDMDLILEEIVSYIMQYTGRIPAEDFTLDLKDRKDHIVMNVINREKNLELLERVPHKSFLDLEVIYRIVMTQDEDGLNTVLITHDILEELGITEEELDTLAMENTMRMFPAVMMSMNERIYMMTNTIKLNGATTMLYMENIRDLSNKLGNDLFVIPSSIHEVMLIPEKCADLTFLKETLARGNQLYVTPKEFLSENVYFYNRKKDTIKLAG